MLGRSEDHGQGEGGIKIRHVKQDEVVLESLKAHDIRHYKARTDVATGSHEKHSPLNSSRLACQADLWWSPSP
eukprot:symbB.v1.2.028547.t1/scaffold3031.1/size66479/4